MPIEQIGNSLRARFVYRDNTTGAGKTGLTDLRLNARGPGGNILTGFTTTLTEVDATNIPGLYEYVLAAGSVTAEGEYIFVARTADTTVAQQYQYAQWYVGRAGIEDLDAAVSSRSDHTPANVRTEMDANSAKLDVAVSTRLATTGYATPLDAVGVRNALGMASANLDIQLASLLARLPAVVISGTVSGSTTTTGFAAAAGLSSQDDFYKGSVVAFTSGALQGLARRVTGYTGSTRTFIFAVPLPAEPSTIGPDTFIILGRIDAAP